MKPKIILFLPSFESGGVERNAIYFVNGMIKNGFDVHVLYCRKTDDWFSKLDSRVIEIKIPRWFRFPLLHERVIDAINMLFFSVFKILSIRNRRCAAIVSFQSNVIAIILALLCKVPIAVRLSNHYVVSEHERSLLRKLSEFGKKCLYRFANVVIANSSELAKDYKVLLNREVITIPNPVDFELVEFLKEKTLGELLFTEKQRPIIITAGRLVPQKNFPLILRAMTRLVNEIPCDLVILGEGSEREYLERMTRELGLTEYVHFFGYRDNVYKYFKYSDVFALSSNYEGMPNVLIEAIACGLPVVATRCKTGPSEILCDGKGGELVSVGDHSALAKALQKTLNSPISAKTKMKVACQNLLKYDLSKVNDEYVCLLNDLIGKSV